QHAGPLSDAQLVERFGARRDEAAFAELVRRHGPMVHGVCRGVLGGGPDAEDAFQATFLVLAKKAGSIRRRDAVGSWLYRVAHHLALRGRASKSRATPVPRKEAMATADPLLDLTVRELRQALHEELGRLPEKYRAPLVLCYLEGRTQDEAARQLGWSKSTLRRRLEHGRELLRARLTRRGLSFSAALLGTLLAPTAASSALPAALAAATLRPGLSAAGGKAAGLSAASLRVMALADGLTRALFVARLQAV